MPPFALVGGSPVSNKAGKARENSSPGSAHSDTCKKGTFDIYVSVNAAECYCHVQHSFVSSDPIKVMNQAKKEAVLAQVRFLHEEKKWDGAARKEVPNPMFQTKYAGLCSVDPNDALITGVEEFVVYVQQNIIEPNSSLWDSVTYFFKRTPFAVPEKFETYPAFLEEVQKFTFAYTTPDVLSRLLHIERHLLANP